MVRIAWQRLRAEYIELAQLQSSGTRVDLMPLAQLFIDMNTALQSAMTARRPSKLGDLDTSVSVDLQE